MEQVHRQPGLRREDVIKVRFICKKYGHKFTAEILEEGEAEEKGFRA